MTAYETALHLVHTTCLGVAPADENLQPLAKPTREPEVIRGWQDEFAGANFVVPSGRKYNFFCLEIDEFAFPNVSQQFEQLPQSWRTQRRPGLVQIWLQAVFEPPLEIRRGPLHNRLFIVHNAPVPGSAVNGAAYQWLAGHSPSECKLAWLPSSWKEVLRTSGRRPNSPRPFINPNAPVEFDPSKTGTGISTTTNIGASGFLDFTDSLTSLLNLPF